MSQLEHIDAIARRLWAADTLRANSNDAGNEYCLPVMGLVFLRHAYSRYLAVKDEVTHPSGRMNLAVHGLEGDIRQAITYDEDPHELLGKADDVTANPPFNVDETDADKVTTDPRLPFGLPGVNKKGKVSNGNYVWISCFYGYLHETGRAGFVTSSQASGAGGGEAEVRRRLVETGGADVIKKNFEELGI